jgi:hypothetical protein
MSTTCPECGTLGRLVTKTDSGRAVYTCPQCPETLVDGVDGSQILSGPRWLGPKPATSHARPAMFQRRTDEGKPRFKARGGRR